MVSAPLSAADHEHLLDTDGFPIGTTYQAKMVSHFEPKASDWGRLKGRLVALDYSTPAHDTPEEIAELRRAACGEYPPQRRGAKLIYRNIRPAIVGNRPIEAILF